MKYLKEMEIKIPFGTLIKEFNIDKQSRKIPTYAPSVYEAAKKAYDKKWDDFFAKLKAENTSKKEKPRSKRPDDFEQRKEKMLKEFRAWFDKLERKLEN